MKSWLLVMLGPAVILDCLVLPPTNHLESKEVQFDKVVIGLLGLPRFVNPTCGQYKLKLAIGAKMTRFLINTGGGYHLGSSE
jgi:hypothetical protein